MPRQYLYKGRVFLVDMLPPKTCLLLVGLCLLFRYSVCDGPRIRTCTTDADCTYLGDAFCDSTSPESCKCDSGFYPYIGDTPVPDAGSASPDVNCLGQLEKNNKRISIKLQIFHSNFSSNL